MLRRNQRGFTLVELLAVAAVFGVLGLMFMNFTVSSYRTYMYLQAQSNGTADLTTVIGRVSKVVRGTTSIVDAQQNSITMYAYFSPNDAVVDKVRYFVSGTDLKVGIIPPSGTAPNYTYDSANETVKTIASNLSMGSTPVFTYYNDTGGSLGTSFNISQIRQIGIAVISNPDPKRLKVPLSNQTIVTLRNMKTNL